MAFDKIPSVPATLFSRPFADNGTYQMPPDDKAGPGRASQKEGFPSETQVPLSQGGIAPNRLDFNGAFHMLSAFAFWQQSGGLWPHNAAVNYQQPAIVVAEGAIWWCVNPSGPATSAGAVAPGTNAAYWKNFAEFLGVGSAPVAGPATPALDGSPQGIVTLAADSDKTSRDKAATPAGVAAQIASSGAIWGQSLTNPGYVKHPNGFIMQWGQTPSSGGATFTVTYPIPFPSLCVNVQATIGPGSYRKGIWGVNLISNTTCQITMNDINNSGGSAPVYWQAIGW